SNPPTAFFRPGVAEAVDLPYPLLRQRLRVTLKSGAGMEQTTIPRHKTATRRGDFSRPVKYPLRDGLVRRGLTFFDSRSGRGEDLELLAAGGISCTGWDPAYRPDAPRQEADVVNLGYVLNVIENTEERASSLRNAWALCRQVLAVAAQVLVAGRGKTPVEF